MSELVAPISLGEHLRSVGSGAESLALRIDSICDRIEACEERVRALLPEPERRARLQREAEALPGRHPEPAARPPLFGALVAVKDIFRVDGFATRGGSALPPELFSGAEASSVTRLREAGALVLGKTVTTEFAYVDPGSTANPHDLRCTPGGSSSGSAAAVAAGYAPLALGTQTVGSVIRPAAFCGVVGFKPSAGRIPIDGVIPFSRSVDHVGTFTTDAASARLAASVLCDRWEDAPPLEGALPALGLPAGEYLAPVDPDARRAFEAGVTELEKAGCRLVPTAALADIEALRERHGRLIAAEFAQVHADWFRAWGALYRPRSAMMMRAAAAAPPDAVERGRESSLALRRELESHMDARDIACWVSPATPGPAPRGLDSTGDPAMNLPWTHAGLPTVTLPAGRLRGLPLGLQLSARFGSDELLLAWAQRLEPLLRERFALLRDVSAC